MANNDDQLATSRYQIASREATDALSERRLSAPATVAGIPIASAILLPADHLHAESAWNQHIPFAFWLVEAHRPSIFVELGTFRGTSYFSFCQAVAALRLSTRCFAVDTWQGDSHTGFYDESVFARVNACNELKYASFSRLVRSSFDEALRHFLDGSIDLLHIDGLHTYQACRHDFESWLPKLSPRAIVLFHDTNVRERGFGVHRLWTELAERYPHFEFLHEHGLGVLGVGAALDAPMRELFAAADDAALTCEVRSTFWRLASAVQAKIDLKASGDERARLETLLGVTIGECEIEVSRLTTELAGLRPALEEKERQAAELTAQCAAAHSENAELGWALTAARSETAELGRTLAAARSENAELGRALAAARSENAELGRALAAARGENAELGSALAMARSETAHFDRALAEARGETAELGRALAAARGENAGLNDALATARQVGTDQHAALDTKATELAAACDRAERAEAASAAARKELDAIHRSTSWRITQPLRQVAGRSRFARHASQIVKLLWWAMTFQLGARVRAYRVRRANIKLIVASGLFDSDWYLEQYPDVRAAGINPLVHYLRHGAAEGRDPNPWFDSAWYLAENPDVQATGVDPLAHYLRHGAAEGRDGNPPLSTVNDLDGNPAVRASSVAPLVHDLPLGRDEGPANGTGPCPDRCGVERSSAIEAWADYTAVKYKIAHMRDVARAQFQPKAHTIIRLNNDDPIKFAKRIALPNPKAPPLVSIVIPVYDAVTYALECLTSVSINSGAVAFEVIVGDDGSTDHTSGILRNVDNIVYFKNEINCGFGKTCNRAMDYVRGRYVVFLNSDTQVCAGWLEEMVRTFTDEIGVGAVGPKLVFPDGRLQEAGAHINRDGTTTLIGLFDDPELPRYNRRREVAYCSGACLMVEASVFKSLGGFDDVFAPAYSEDADLAFRLRERGLRVIYTPRSLVIHHLSMSTTQVSSEYKMSLCVRNQQRFCERWQKHIDDLNAVRVIAFYLPQFHPIRENDVNWGNGFTEWRNVAKAAPNFLNHYQPRLPADLGFYDLRVVDVIEEQARLAKKYGIYGFCFYYYWFNGRRVLEMPLERLLATGKPDIPFCIAWANENWTRKWDGRDQDVILAQSHSDGDDAAVIRDMTRYLCHPNYIRIGGRPLLIIYRPGLFPNIRRTAETWRAWCRAEGIGEILLAMVGAMEHSIPETNPANLGFDAVIEFPPHGADAPIDVPGPVVNARFRGNVHDYIDTAMKYGTTPLPGHLLIRGVMPGWDNTPRNQDEPLIYLNASPGSYQAWLETAMQDMRETTFGEERCVFVNAWNEWAEGAFLEPDVRFGHQYLEATRNAHYAWLMRNISSADEIS